MLSDAAGAYSDKISFCAPLYESQRVYQPGFASHTLAREDQRV